MPKRRVSKECLLDAVDPRSDLVCLGGAFEGDMILDPNSNPRQLTRGAAILGVDNRWPNNVVPYDLTNITG